MSDLKKLQDVSKDFTILYVEDNDSLRKNATKLLQKFFPTVYVGRDGIEGLKLFKKHRPLIVITDIKMPKLDGMEMSKKIRYVSPNTKIIIMSAFDEKDYLYKAIEIGVYRFIKKPVSIQELSHVLYQAIVQIQHERSEHLFLAQLGNIFNYQSSMIAMLEHTKPTIANQALLDFYDVEDIDELNEKYPDIGVKFLEHDGFLYNDKDNTWINKVLVDRSRIFNVKMINNQGQMRHFILKCKDIPNKNNYGILSFDDITELNLLGLFDKNTALHDNSDKTDKALFEFLSVIQRNSAKISLHNYYKGISITNSAILDTIGEESVVLKTSYVQQKAINYERRSLIVSEALPFPITCDKLLKLEFEKQSVEFTQMKFSKTSPVSRETVRLIPEESHSVTLFVGDHKYTGDLHIEDISLSAIKLGMSAMPAGFDIDTDVTIDMVLKVDKRPLIINTKATLFKKREANRIFEAIFTFDLDVKTRVNLVKYISKRQMALIREFKGL